MPDQEKPAVGFEYFLKTSMSDNDDIINGQESSEESRDSAKAAQLDLKVLEKCYYEEKDEREGRGFLVGLKAGWNLGLIEDTDNYAAAVINRGKTYLDEQI